MDKATLPLFTPLKVGSLSLPHRIIMAALTRVRADPKTSVPTDLHAEYYSQRAGAGFILTECSQIAPEGSCYPEACGIYSEAQVSGWKKVTDAVHAKGGRIILQIWHAGRAAHPDLHEGKQGISSSNEPIRDLARTPNGKVPHATPRAMEAEDFRYVLESFRKGAENAKKAGFDGVQLHGANGYLVDQFLRDSANHRKDEYGGSIENRCRFPLQIVDQLVEVFGGDRVGVKVSPLGRYQDMSDSDPVALYGYFFEELNKRNVAYVEVMEKNECFAGPSKNLHPHPDSQMKGTVAENLRRFFKGIYIANNNLTCEMGNEFIEKGWADAVSYGRMYISNPDLAERFRNGWPLIEPQEEFFYSKGEKGYTDYPFYTPPEKI